MAMNYNSLVAPKGTTGSIANWVGYGKIDIETILAEAQSILFQSLRVREMRTSFVFSLAPGQSTVSLPPNYLDPIGDIIDGHSNTYRNSDEGTIRHRRVFDDAGPGTLPNNPFSTTDGSSLISVNMPNHGLTQNSMAAFAGAGGFIPDKGYPVVSITDANTIVVDNVTPIVGTATGGGAAVAWTANRLIDGQPMFWAVFDEALQFDIAMDVTNTAVVPCSMLYFRRPDLLSATNQTNFLTDRYPRLIREATNAAAASMMKDDSEEQKALQKLAALIDATNAESDLSYRGASLYTDTPTPGDYY